MYSDTVPSRMKIVRPRGHITSANAVDLQQHLTETVISTEHSVLGVDMSCVESLDSSGLMVFVSILTLAQRLNKRLALFGISPSVRIVFELTQLDQVFEILDEHPVLEAVAA